jgi:hypothetical protein
MPTFVSLVACAILLGVAILHGALARGAALGRFAWGGQHDVLPSNLRRMSAITIALNLFYALIILQGADIINPFTDLLGRIAIWVLTVWFFVAFILNARSISRSEQVVMGPVNLVLAALTLIVAITGRIHLL